MAETAYTHDSPSQEAEEWRPVLGWEGFYEVSSLGRVRSLDRIVEYEVTGRLIRRPLKGAMMGQFPSKGYPFVRLSDGERRRSVGVHTLVCEAFLGPRPREHEAAHKDGDRSNSRLGNLRWATHAENMSDCIAHGTRVFGARHGQARLTLQQVTKIRSTFDSAALRDLAAEYGIHLNHAHAVRRGTRYQTKEI